jgi:hypothetical protein
MHTVELLKRLLEVARGMGYGVREDWLGGSGGGGCEIKGRKWIFLDLAQGPAEHLDQVTETLRRDPALAGLDIPNDLLVQAAPRKVA